MDTGIKSAILLFIHGILISAPTSDRAIVGGTSAIALGICPKKHLAIVIVGAMAKYFAVGKYAIVGEITRDIAATGIAVSAMYSIWCMKKHQTEK